MTIVVWSPETRRHDPQAEIWVGVRTPGTEVAERVDVILAALEAAGGFDLREATPYDDESVLAVHDADLVAHLRDVIGEWAESGIPDLVGQDRVVPYMFATPRMLDGLPGRRPSAVHARAGWYCFDTMTLVGPGTWEAARAAADCALTAVALVLGGEPLAYACTRPPGHHVTRSAYGGSCYLNNAAIAAAALHKSLDGPVALLDVDAHHGNGTQEIFYERSDLLVGSV